MMTTMITASLLLNIVVLVPVCAGIVRDAEWARATYGARSPARGILLSIYLAILGVSAVLLARPLPQAVTALLVVQIAYKVTTPLTVGTVRNPVVVSNLLIAAVHAVTVGLIWQAGVWRG